MQRLYKKLVEEGWPMDKKFTDLSAGEMAYLIQWIIEIYDEEMNRVPF